MPRAFPCTTKVADIEIVTVGLGIRAEVGSAWLSSCGVYEHLQKSLFLVTQWW